MWLTLHDEGRARKSLICDPANETKSVVLTDRGLQKAEELFDDYLARKP